MDYYSTEYISYLHKCWKQFIRHEEGDFSAVRPEILASWTRSREYVTNPEKVAGPVLTEEELAARRAANQPILDIVRPYMEQIYSVVKGTEIYILFSDKEGYVLEIIGDSDMTEKFRSQSSLMVGVNRSEKTVGTNGIGTALAARAPIQIWSEEHYLKPHKKYTCSGAPVFDQNGDVVGCLNVTGKVENVHPHTLGMVICAADGITNEIKLRSAYSEINLISSQRNSMIESMDTGVILLDRAGRVIQCNNNALQILELEGKNLSGENLFGLITINQYRTPEEHMQFFRSPCSHREINVFHGKNKTNPLRITISANPINISGGSTQGTILILQEQKALRKLMNTVGGFKAKYTFESIVGESPAVQDMISACRHAAMTASNILILGESGTGKELVAQAIHSYSPYSGGSFVAVNCASLPRDLVESELFGYERGAFTGASREGHPGKFELAEGGTIFLDEIGDMPLEAQSSLLRVIETREVTRIGGKYPKPINVRIIAATNRDLRKSIEDRTFRKDLYYRLNVMTIEVPPLSVRGDDISLLCDHFLKMYGVGKEYSIDPEVLAIFRRYSWPGNIRQLENTIERSINLAEGLRILPSHIPGEILDEVFLSARPQEPLSLGLAPPAGFPRAAGFTPADPRLAPAKDSAAQQKNAPGRMSGALEKDQIMHALRETHGNVTRAVTLLQTSRRTLYRRLEAYGIDPAEFR